jgi:hypothetical protein
LIEIPIWNLKGASARPTPPTAAIVLASTISHKMYFLGKARVMLDSDFAPLYGDPTSNLNQAVRRNFKRFPKNFMFQLDKEGSRSFQITICHLKKGRPRRPPVFSLRLH